jgi:hypothetical protein
MTSLSPAISTADTNVWFQVKKNWLKSEDAPLDILELLRNGC